MTSPTADLTVQTMTLDSGFSLGLRQEWITAEGGNGVTAHLTSGAGLASPYLGLMIEREDGETIYEAVDVTDFLPSWIDAALARADAPAEV